MSDGQTQSEFSIKTHRLIIRPWRDQDLEPFSAMNQDKEVMRFTPGLLTIEESNNQIAARRKEFENLGFCLWACELKSTGEFIGSVGLTIHDFKAHFTPAVGVGWKLVRNHWGKGYAIEAAAFVLQWAFSKQKLPEIVSITSLLNKKSIRIMEKLGMTHESKDDFYHPRVSKEHFFSRQVLYRMTLSQWEEVSPKLIKDFVQSVNLRS